MREQHLARLIGFAIFMALFLYGFLFVLFGGIFWRSLLSGAAATAAVALILLYVKNGYRTRRLFVPVLGALLLAMVAVVGCTILTFVAMNTAPNEHDVRVVALDASGTETWRYFIEGEADDTVHCVIEAVDGGIIIGGGTASAGQGSSFNTPVPRVIKLDRDGRMLWEWIGNDSSGSVFALAPTSDGGCVFSSRDGRLQRIDGNGIAEDPLRPFPGGRVIERMIRTADRGFALAGTTEDRRVDLWVARLDQSGVVLWDRTYGSDGIQGGGCIAQTSDEGFLVGGRCEMQDQGDSDAWLLRLDASGNLLWERTFGGAGYDWCEEVRENPDLTVACIYSFNRLEGDHWIRIPVAASLSLAGDIITESEIPGGELAQWTGDGGYIYAGASGKTLTAGHSDDAGNLIREYVYGPAGWDNVVSVLSLSDGGSVICGMTWRYGLGI